MSNKKIALLFGVAVQFSALGAASAQDALWTPSVLKVNAPDPLDLARVQNGRLRRTDEEFTNEQAVVNFMGDGKSGLYVEMRTGALEGVKPVHRMQAACTPIGLEQGTDGSVDLVKKPGSVFITDNRGNEYRNANKPELIPINSGKNMLVMFNYQPEGTNDTRRYVKVLDAACKPVQLLNNQNMPVKQVVVMAKNNDDCDMHQSGDGGCDVAADANGNTHLVCWAGCNGNGRDDGWLNDFNVQCTNDAATGVAQSCKVTKNFDVSLAQREERSRGRCSVAAADPNTAVCTWTEGNNQPQRDGTWIAAVDIGATGPRGAEAQARIVWKKMIEGRKQIELGPNNVARTYSVRAKSTRVMAETAAGKLEATDMLIIHTGDLQGNNNDNRKGGRYVAMRLGVAKATRAGLEWVVPMQDATNMMLGIDGTHLTMATTVVQDGINLLPSVTFLQGSQNGGGAASPDLKVIALDIANKKFMDYGTYSTGGSYDRHLYANYLGNNPGNQGRNFAGARMVANPYYNVNNNQQKYLLLHALTGKDPVDAVNPALKPASFVTLMPMVAKGLPPVNLPALNGTGGGQMSDPSLFDPLVNKPTPTTNTGSGSGTGVGAGTGTGTGTGTGEAGAPSVMGCRATAGSGPSSGIFFLGLIVAVGLIVRRKRA